MIRVSFFSVFNVVVGFAGEGSNFYDPIPRINGGTLTAR